MSANADVEAERADTVREAVAALWVWPIRGREGADPVILGYD